MIPARRWLKASPIDSFDVVFGVLPAAASYAAFVTWASLIVRALRGEDVKEDWRTFVASGALLGAYGMKSATQVREMVALRGATADVRRLAMLANEEAHRRDQRAADQARREDERQESLERLTKRLVLIASLTLAVAVVALVVSLISLL